MPLQQSILALGTDNAGSFYVGYVAADGTAYAGYATGGGLDNITWYREFDGAQSIAFTVFPWFRIGVLDNGGTFWVKQGGMSADWTLEANGVSQGVLGLFSGDLERYYGRLGVINTNAQFDVKEGALGSPWTLEANNTVCGLINGYRIGFIDAGATLNVKEGSLGATWVLEANDVLQACLDGSNIGQEAIGIIDNTNQFSMKVGPLDANWALQPFTDVQQIALAGGKVGVLTGDGTFSVGDSASPQYGAIATDASFIAVSNRLVAYIRRGDGAVLAKTDGAQDWTVLAYTTGGPLKHVT